MRKTVTNALSSKKIQNWARKKQQKNYMAKANTSNASKSFSENKRKLQKPKQKEPKQDNPEDQKYSKSIM